MNFNNALWKYRNSGYHVETSESGLHTDLYLNTDYIVSDPVFVEKVVVEFEKILHGKNVDWVVTYPPFGIALGYALARKIGVKFGYINGESCNFDIKKKSNIVVVADDIYSGGSIKKTIKIMRDMEVSVLTPILSIGNFSGVSQIEGVKVCSIVQETGNLYEKKDCPMCKAGSKAILPRKNWELLKN